MEKKQIRLKAFNKLFMELLNDLEAIRPNDSTLLWVKTVVSVLDDQTLVDQYMEYVEEYSEKILKKDESFFLNEMDNPENSFAAKEIERIKGIWVDKDTTDDTKECIWKYLILLLKLGRSIQN